MKKTLSLILFSMLLCRSLQAQGVEEVKSTAEKLCKEAGPFRQTAKHIIESNTDRGADLTVYSGGQGIVMARLSVGFSARDEVVEVVWKNKKILKMQVVQKRFDLNDEGEYAFDKLPRVTSVAKAYYSQDKNRPDVFEKSISTFSDFEFAPITRSSFNKLAALLQEMVDQQAKSLTISEDDDTFMLLLDK